MRAEKKPYGLEIRWSRKGARYRAWVKNKEVSGFIPRGTFPIYRGVPALVPYVPETIAPARPQRRYPPVGSLEGAYRVVWGELRFPEHPVYGVNYYLHKDPDLSGVVVEKKEMGSRFVVFSPDGEKVFFLSRRLSVLFNRDSPEERSLLEEEIRELMEGESFLITGELLYWGYKAPEAIDKQFFLPADTLIFSSRVLQPLSGEVLWVLDEVWGRIRDLIVEGGDPNRIRSLLKAYRSLSMLRAYPTMLGALGSTIRCKTTLYHGGEQRLVSMVVFGLVFWGEKFYWLEEPREVELREIDRVFRKGRMFRPVLHREFSVDDAWGVHRFFLELSNTGAEGVVVRPLDHPTLHHEYPTRLKARDSTYLDMLYGGSFPFGKVELDVSRKRGLSYTMQLINRVILEEYRKTGKVELEHILLNLAIEKSQKVDTRL